jgi:hypothetical protein
MFMRPLNDLLQIVRSGGSLDLQAGNLSTDDLAQLAGNASEKVTLILRGLSTRSTTDLIRIKTLTAATVIFVFD